jgi:hypothetical protein
MNSEKIWLKLKTSSRPVYRRRQNFQAHSQAGEKHTEMFLPSPSEYATGLKGNIWAVDAARETLNLHDLARRDARRTKLSLLSGFSKVAA